MPESRELPRILLITIGVVQGIMLYFLYYAYSIDAWPSESPLWSYPLWTVAVVSPILLLLTLENENQSKTMKYILGYSVVLALVALYTGSQALPYGEFQLSSMNWIFALSIALASFKALMYMQQRIAGRPFSYDILFVYSWRNFLTYSLASLFAGIFWLILMLWAQLFHAIEIDFFRELFGKEWFIFPILGFAFALGVVIFRNLVRIIDSITRLLQGLIKILLPLVVAVAVGFLAALPFVGLDALWSTGNGTGLLLWLLAIVLFFSNAVFQDGKGSNPYPKLIHRGLYCGLLTLPVISALSLYGLYLRLSEYGWTVARSWAFVVWLLLTLIAVGYAVGIVRLRDRWQAELARVNTAMGLVVLAMLLAVNSPLIDFRKISIASQLARVESGLLELKDFDFWYVSRQLARPGYLAMQRLKGDLGDSDPDLLAQIDSPRRSRHPAVALSSDEIWEQTILRPADMSLPDSLKAKIDSSRVNTGIGPEAIYTMIQIDLNDDQIDEFVLISSTTRYIYDTKIFYRSGDEWTVMQAIHESGRQGTGFAKRLAQGEIRTPANKFHNLQIGDIVFVPMGSE